jgi:hypothetical protein
MSERKSQLEKFNARMSKMKRDEQVIKQKELENSTVEKKAEKIAKQHGVSTEEIFAIITRESISGFVQLWNNSMESTIRETIRGEVREIIREVVQEQMIEAYKGIVKGMTDVESIVKEEMKNAAAETIAPPLAPYQIKAGLAHDLGQLQVSNPEQYMNEPEREKRVGTFKKKRAGRQKIYTQDFEEELREAVLKGDADGVIVGIGKHFKKSSSRNSTLYQKFLQKNKGVSGAWANYVANILNEEGRI